MLGSRLSRLQGFVYSHHFLSGVRRGLGVLLVFALAFYGLGANSALIAALGALCVALIDQPGPLHHRAREMLGGVVLGALAVGVTGFASSHPVGLIIAVVAQTFIFSMFAVYGKRGGIIGLACLILTIVTMHTPLTPDQVLAHASISIGGALTYTIFSMISSRPLQVREEEQCLSVALFATADYVAARGEMYDAGIDIDESYRQLIATQSRMSEQHQAARDMILRGMNKASVSRSKRRLMVWNVLVDMINMLDMLVATHTDYTLLHRKLAHADALLFMRDALGKMALELERIALAVTQEKRLTRRNSVKAELRALEFEIETMRRDGYAKQEPEAYALCVQILRRLRNINRVIERMVEQTHFPKNATPLLPAQLETSLSGFLSRQSFRPGLITSNLRLDSPPFRFALRVSLAVAIGLSIGLLIPQIGPHGYWIVLTIIVIMKPAFSLTKQRNNARLVGTLLGCMLAFVLLYSTNEPRILLIALAISIIAGFSLLIVHYLSASVFNTVSVLIVLHFLLPESFDLVSERALDTVIGSLIALACSYFLPWWESRSLPSLAAAAIRANENYLRAGIQTIHEPSADPLAWPLARQSMQVAFSNFAEAFYRMMGEPLSRQQNVAEFNNLLIQTHIMAAEVAATVHQIQAHASDSTPATAILEQLADALKNRDLKSASMEITAQSPEAETPDWVYPLKQLQRAIQGIVRESASLHPVAQP